jgi:hypothetical protein
MNIRNLIAPTSSLEDAFYTTTGIGFDHNQGKESDLSVAEGVELLEAIGSLMAEFGRAVCEIRGALPDWEKAKAAEA